MAMYSYKSTLALPCRGCGGNFRDDDKVVPFQERRWHVRCFACQRCKKPFKETDRPPAVGELPYCPACHVTASQTLCGGCRQAIVEGRFLQPQGVHKKFHVGCFVCCKCGASLEGGFRARQGFAFCPKCPPVPPKPGEPIAKPQAAAAVAAPPAAPPAEAPAPAAPAAGAPPPQ